MFVHLLTIKNSGMRKFMMVSSLFLFSIAGYSQFVIFGAKAGLNLATVTGNDIENASLHPSFHVGALANFFINEKFTIQPEVMYSGKGAKGEGGVYNMGYINVPVLVQYRTPSGFFVEAGPQVGFLMNAKFKATGQSNTDFKQFMKSTDYSWVGGIGYKSAMGIGATARYDFGFFNVAKDGIIRNKAIMISLFYVFGSTSSE
jgi:hypothetical protein